MTGPAGIGGGGDQLHHPEAARRADRVTFEVTWWVRAQFRARLDAGEVAGKLRAANWPEAADVAARIARREITSGDATEDIEDGALGTLAYAIRENEELFEVGGTDGEPGDWESADSYHVYAGPGTDAAMSRTQARTPVLADQLPPAVRDAVACLVRYNWASEERDYGECGPGGNSREGHVYLDLILLSCWLGSRGGQETGTSLDALTADAARLGTKIAELTGSRDAAEAVGTGRAAEEAGRSLQILTATLAAAIGQADPQAARQLLQFTARLTDTVDCCAGPGEHDTSASTGIADQLAAGIALVERAIRAQQDGTPPAARH